MKIQTARILPTRLIALLCLIVFGFQAPHSHAQIPAAQQRERVSSAAQQLAASYDKTTGLFHGTGWWNSANGVTALVNASRALHTSQFDSILQNTFTQAQQKNPGFLNEFYDDEGWWALAWLDLYDLRGGSRYLNARKPSSQT